MPPDIASEPAPDAPKGNARNPKRQKVKVSSPSRLRILSTLEPSRGSPYGWKCFDDPQSTEDVKERLQFVLDKLPQISPMRTHVQHRLDTHVDDYYQKPSETAKAGCLPFFTKPLEICGLNGADRAPFDIQCRKPLFSSLDKPEYQYYSYATKVWIINSSQKGEWDPLSDYERAMRRLCVAPHEWFLPLYELPGENSIPLLTPMAHETITAAAASCAPPGLSDSEWGYTRPPTFCEHNVETPPDYDAANSRFLPNSPSSLEDYRKAFKLLGSGLNFSVHDPSVADDGIKPNDEPGRWYGSIMMFDKIIEHCLCRVNNLLNNTFHNKDLSDVQIHDMLRKQVSLLHEASNFCQKRMEVRHNHRDGRSYTSMNHTRKGSNTDYLVDLAIDVASEIANLQHWWALLAAVYREFGARKISLFSNDEALAVVRSLEESMIVMAKVTAFTFTNAILLDSCLPLDCGSGRRVVWGVFQCLLMESVLVESDTIWPNRSYKIGPDICGDKKLMLSFLNPVTLFQLISELCPRGGEFKFDNFSLMTQGYTTRNFWDDFETLMTSILPNVLMERTLLRAFYSCPKQARDAYNLDAMLEEAAGADVPTAMAIFVNALEQLRCKHGLTTMAWISGMPEKYIEDCSVNMMGCSAYGVAQHTRPTSESIQAEMERRAIEKEKSRNSNRPSGSSSRRPVCKSTKKTNKKTCHNKDNFPSTGDSTLEIRKLTDADLLYLFEVKHSAEKYGYYLQACLKTPTFLSSTSTERREEVSALNMVTRALDTAPESFPYVERGEMRLPPCVTNGDSRLFCFHCSNHAQWSLAVATRTFADIAYFFRNMVVVQLQTGHYSKEQDSPYVPLQDSAKYNAFSYDKRRSFITWTLGVLSRWAIRFLKEARMVPTLSKIVSEGERTDHGPVHSWAPFIGHLRWALELESEYWILLEQVLEQVATLNKLLTSLNMSRVLTHTKDASIWRDSLRLPCITQIPELWDGTGGAIMRRQYSKKETQVYKTLLETAYGNFQRPRVVDQNLDSVRPIERKREVALAQRKKEIETRVRAKVAEEQSFAMVSRLLAELPVVKDAILRDKQEAARAQAEAQSAAQALTTLRALNRRAAERSAFVAERAAATREEARREAAAEKQRKKAAADAEKRQIEQAEALERRKRDLEDRRRAKREQRDRVRHSVGSAASSSPSPPALVNKAQPTAGPVEPQWNLMLPLARNRKKNPSIVPASAPTIERVASHNNNSNSEIRCRPGETPKQLDIASPTSFSSDQTRSSFTSPIAGPDASGTSSSSVSAATPTRQTRGVPQTSSSSYAPPPQKQHGECVVCFDNFSKPQATGCGHVFCAGCAPKVGEECFTCRTPVTMLISLFI